MGAAWPETHSVLVTENTEYHVVDGVCVAVRDRPSGEWRLAHTAVGGRIIGSLRGSRYGSFSISDHAPETGDRVIFSTDVVTSPVRTLGSAGPEAFAGVPTLGAA